MRYLDEDEIERLFDNKPVNFEEDGEVGTAFVYYDNTGMFAVVVLSRNPFIEDINRMLLWGMLLLVVLSAGVLYIISRLYALRVFNRIDQDYQAEKMFVNNASHEINNPLTAIQGECEVALMVDQQPEAYRDVLQRIAKETNRIINIMGELLQLAHARDGYIDKEKMQTVRLSSVVEAESKGNVLVSVQNDFCVNTDADMLRIAIHNLVSNAMKYSSGNPVSITVNCPHLTIEDRGIGIPPADLKHIFQPFYRASNVGAVSGKGVGLALAKTILERLGAKIQVASHVDTGTIFKVTFCWSLQRMDTKKVTREYDFLSSLFYISLRSGTSFRC